MTGLKTWSKRIAFSVGLIVFGGLLSRLPDYIRAYHTAAVQAHVVYQFLTEPIAPGPDGKPRNRADALREQFPAFPSK